MPNRGTASAAPGPGAPQAPRVAASEAAETRSTINPRRTIHDPTDLAPVPPALPMLAEAADPAPAHAPVARAERRAAAPAGQARERDASLPAARNPVRLASGTSRTVPRESPPYGADPVDLESPLEEDGAQNFELGQAPEASRDPVDAADAPWTAQEESDPPARGAADAIPVRPAVGRWKPAGTLQAVDPPQPLPRPAVEPHGLGHVHPAHWETRELPAPAASIESADELAEDEGEAWDPPEDSESTLRIVGIRDGA